MKIYYLMKGKKKFKQRINYLKYIVTSKNRKITKGKNSINRLNSTCIDHLFIKELNKKFSNTDGFGC